MQVKTKRYILPIIVICHTCFKFSDMLQYKKIAMFNDVKSFHWVYLCITVTGLIHYYSWIDHIDKLILIEKNFFKAHPCVKMIHYSIKMRLTYFSHSNVAKTRVIRLHDQCDHTDFSNDVRNFKHGRFKVDYIFPGF